MYHSVSHLGAEGIQTSSRQGHASGANDFRLELRVGLRGGHFRRTLSHALAHDANARPAPQRHEEAARCDVLHGRARGHLVAVGVGDVDPGKAFAAARAGRGGAEENMERRRLIGRVYSDVLLYTTAASR